MDDSLLTMMSVQDDHRQGQHGKHRESVRGDVEDPKNPPKAVSYTHLDVYKRQRLGSSPCLGIFKVSANFHVSGKYAKRTMLLHTVRQRVYIPVHPSIDATCTILAPSRNK